MTFTLVSIVIPCHNAGPWIRDAVHSALAQAYSPVQVVVVDDGSTDGSREIIESFGDRIRAEFTEHRGAPHARNRGIQLSSGEFVQFLDADDILFPHCVGRKVKTALASGADVVYSGGFFFDVGGNAGVYEPQSAPCPDRARVVAHVIASTIVTTLLMCRKTALETIGGFDEGLAKGQEHDLLFRLAVGGYKLAYTPEALSLNRTNHNPNSITRVTSQDPSDLESLYCRFEKTLRDTSLWVAPVRAALALRFHFTGVEYLRTGDKARAPLMFQRARQVYPSYASNLPFSRRCLVPVLGACAAERFLAGLRRRVPRSRN